jgi:hypothetical protein
MAETVGATNKAPEITVKHTVDRACCAVWQGDDVIIVDRLQARELARQILAHLGLDDASSEK